MTDKKPTANDEDIEWMTAALHLQYEGQPDALARLLLSGSPVPAVVRPFLASFIRGEVKLPDQRGKANAKLPFDDVLTIRNGLFKVYLNTERILIFAELLADERKEEVIDLRRYMEKVRRDSVKKLAARFNVSESTVRQHHEATKTINFAWCLAGKNQMAMGGHALPGIFGDPTNLQSAALEAARYALANPEEAFDPFTE